MKLISILLILLLVSCSENTPEPPAPTPIKERVVETNAIDYILDKSRYGSNFNIQFKTLSAGQTDEVTLNIINKFDNRINFDFQEMIDDLNNSGKYDRFEFVGTTCGDFLDPELSCLLTFRMKYVADEDYNEIYLKRIVKEDVNYPHEDWGVLSLFGYINIDKELGVLNSNDLQLSESIVFFELSQEDVIKTISLINTSNRVIESPKILVPEPYLLMNNNCQDGTLERDIRPSSSCSFQVKLPPGTTITELNQKISFAYNETLWDKEVVLAREQGLESIALLENVLLEGINSSKRIYLQNNGSIDSTINNINSTNPDIQILRTDCSNLLQRQEKCFIDIKFTGNVGTATDTIININNNTSFQVFAGNVRNCTKEDLETNIGLSLSAVIDGVKVGTNIDQCRILSCSEGFDVIANRCIPQNCNLNDAEDYNIILDNVEEVSGNIFTCQISRCEDGYAISEDKKSCEIIPCTLDNAFDNGISMFNVTEVTGSIANCEVNRCVAGFLPSIDRKSCQEAICDLNNAGLFGINTTNVSAVSGTALNCNVIGCADFYQPSVDRKSCIPQQCTLANALQAGVNTSNVISVKNDVFSCEVDRCENNYTISSDKKSCEIASCELSNATSAGININNVKSVKGNILTCEIDECNAGYEPNANKDQCREIICNITNADQYGVNLDNVLGVNGTANDCNVTSCSSLEYKPSQDKKSCELIPCTFENATQYGVNINFVSRLTGGILSCEVDLCDNGYQISEDKKSCVPILCDMATAAGFGIDLNNVVSVEGTALECEVTECAFGFKINPDTKKSCLEIPCGTDANDPESYMGNYGVDPYAVVSVDKNVLNCEITECFTQHNISSDKKSCEPILCDETNAPSEFDVTHVENLSGPVFNCSIDTCDFGYAINEEGTACEPIPCTLETAQSIHGIDILLVSSVTGDGPVCEIDECAFGLDGEGNRDWETTLDPSGKRCNDIPCTLDNAPSYIDFSSGVVAGVTGSTRQCEITSCGPEDNGFFLDDDKISCTQLQCNQAYERFGIVLSPEIMSMFDGVDISGITPECYVNACPTQLDPITEEPNDIYYYEPIRVNGFDLVVDGIPRNNSCQEVPCTVENGFKFGLDTTYATVLSGSKETCRITSCQTGYTPTVDLRGCNANLCDATNVVALAGFDITNATAYSGTFPNCSIIDCQTGFSPSDNGQFCEEKLVEFTPNSGSLTISSGQTVNISAGSLNTYSSLTIESGGVLAINGNTSALTEIGVDGDLILDGTIISNKAAFIGSNNFSTTSRITGESINYSVRQAIGGNGGGTSSANCGGVSGGSSIGGSQNSGNGGGGCGSDNPGVPYSGNDGGDATPTSVGSGGSRGGNGGFRGNHGHSLMIVVNGEIIGSGSINLSGSSGNPGQNASYGAGGGGGSGGSGGFLMIRYLNNISGNINLNTSGGSGGSGGLSNGNAVLGQPSSGQSGYNGEKRILEGPF